MSNRTKTRRSGTLTLALFQRHLHPEFFKIVQQQTVNRRAYEADIWVVEGGHVVSMTAGKWVLCEVISCNLEGLNDRGMLQSLPCRGERNHELTAGSIKYMISTQEEQLTQTLYEATRHEIMSYATKRELMYHDAPASNDGSACLSVLDIECRSDELLVQSFHLFDDNYTVIKTQAIFEVSKTLG